MDGSGKQRLAGDTEMASNNYHVDYQPKEEDNYEMLDAEGGVTSDSRLKRQDDKTATIGAIFLLLLLVSIFVFVLKGGAGGEPTHAALDAALQTVPCLSGQAPDADGNCEFDPKCPYKKKDGKCCIGSREFCKAADDELKDPNPNVLPTVFCKDETQLLEEWCHNVNLFTGNTELAHTTRSPFDSPGPPGVQALAAARKESLKHKNPVDENGSVLILDYKPTKWEEEPTSFTTTTTYTGTIDQLSQNTCLYLEMDDFKDKNGNPWAYDKGAFCRRFCTGKDERLAQYPAPFDDCGEHYSHWTTTTRAPLPLDDDSPPEGEMMTMVLP